MNTINFKEIGKNSGNTSFDALPAGRYPLKIDTAVLTTASTGTPMIEVAFTVIGGQFQNRKMWHNFSLTEKSLVFLYQFLKALGSHIINEEDVNPEDLAALLPGLEVSAWATPGKTPGGNPKNTLSKWSSIDEMKDVMEATDTGEDNMFNFS